jgi:hypothetical protein
MMKCILKKQDILILLSTCYTFHVDILAARTRLRPQINAAKTQVKLAYSKTDNEA